ncbi:uncharacterized protein N7496_009670 [Penicillium cataractarum]|uniref:Xylanolytic transcriptional activator regulatory domain-containing protein n=1 Tax=Penicillium cataractarum TaxID=2100454 RepID=A0A9W9V058_9EURO|nr:uncharacterized protein N7496_009670 [Penicillium cataractarum]KAJ5363957.1 hypothetical protein N7496_009670 [Penicillium cataractarum]
MLEAKTKGLFGMHLKTLCRAIEICPNAQRALVWVSHVFLGNFPLIQSQGPGAAYPTQRFLETLKRKRDDLEARIRCQRPRSNSDAPTEHLDNDPGEHSEGGLTEQNAADNTIQEAMGEIGFLSRSAMAEPRVETGGLSQELSIGHMLHSTLSLGGSNPSESVIDPHGQIVAVMVDPSVTSNTELALPFITRFTEIIGVQFLYINSKELLKDFETFFKASEDATGQNDCLSSVKRFNLYLSLATGVLLSPGSGGLQGLASNYHAAAMGLFPGILGKGTRLDILHCFLSLIIYSVHSALGGSAWHLIGLAMKKAIAFRFHKDIDADAQIAPEMLRARRNIFWDLYTLDRTISTIMDRPFGIEDEDIAVLGPEDYASSARDSDLARHLVSHARFISSIRDAPSKSILHHYSNLCYWRECAPASSFPAVYVMRLSCRAMIEILKVKGSVIIEPSLVRSASSIENDFIKACVEYIEEEYQRSERGEFAGSFVDAYDIFNAGVVIVCLAAGKPGVPLRDANVVNKCTALLTILGERFTGLRVLRRVLWSLSGLVLGESVNDPIIRELPPVIPDGIKDLISGFT